MGKHTKFDSSDDEKDSREEKNHEHRREEKKKHREEKKNRDRSPREDKHREKEREHRGNKYERGDRDRDDNRRRDRDRADRHREYDRRDRDRNREQNDKNRLSQEEIKAQRKALWGNKPKTEESTKETDATPSSSTSVAKNEKLWSSAIAATGVDQSQASKFMRLMGVKNAPKANESNGSDEREKQTKLLSDLERQYAIARETTHMGKGNGLGFH
ncbi:unnamed protein product [Caenorhabditis angaria]|uniref:Small acidic protein-like domain-containing protein n=1 Tax=Caenorhabditis angaria TaxID=860376 RepID=A0A9P1IJZ1_9PELO|nr:unnamed protein product [Caenorhabditis angaria]